MPNETELNDLYYCFLNLREAARFLQHRAINEGAESAFFDWVSSLRSMLQDITHYLHRARVGGLNRDYFDEAELTAQTLECELENWPPRDEAEG